MILKNRRFDGKEYVFKDMYASKQDILNEVSKYPINTTRIKHLTINYALYILK